MKTPALVRPLSPQEYLEGERNSAVKHEYVAGQIFAMTGVTLRHNAVAINLLRSIDSHLQTRTGCRVFMADVQVHVSARDAFYYPDLVVSCGDAALGSYVVDHPQIIVEVLSPSTASIDRREKLLAYQTLPSLNEYLIVNPDAVEATLYRRDSGGIWWQYTLVEGDVVRFESIGLDLPISTIYRSVL